MTDTNTLPPSHDDTDNGLVTAWLLDGKGGGKRIGWQEIADWQAVHGLLWIHLDYSHANSERWLRDESGVSPIIQSVLISEETRPRCELFENGLLAILRGVNLNPGSDPEDMVSVRLWIEHTRIISCRRRRVASIRDLENALARNVGPRAQGGFLAHLSEQLGDKVDAVIESLENETEMLEDLLQTEESRSLRPQLSTIRRTVIHLRRYLAPQRDALKRLQAMEIQWMSQSARSRLNEAADQTQRYLEGLDAIRDQSLVTQEELSQKLSEQTEKRMYLLSIITTVFLPLGFLTGLLGINVGGMPGTGSPIAFWIVCLLALIMGAGTLWILRINRWF
jgi:zinc transporter